QSRQLRGLLLAPAQGGRHARSGFALPSTASLGEIGCTLFRPAPLRGRKGFGLLLLQLALESAHFGSMLFLLRLLRRSKTLERRRLFLVASVAPAPEFGLPLGARRRQPLGFRLLPFAFGGRQLLRVEHHHLGVFFGQRVRASLLEPALDLRDLFGRLLLYLLNALLERSRGGAGGPLRGGVFRLEPAFERCKALVLARGFGRQLGGDLARRLGFPARASGRQLLGRFPLQLLCLSRQVGLRASQLLLQFRQTAPRCILPFGLGGDQGCLALGALTFAQTLFGFGNSFLGRRFPLCFVGGLRLFPPGLGGREAHGDLRFGVGMSG